MDLHFRRSTQHRNPISRKHPKATTSFHPIDPHHRPNSLRRAILLHNRSITRSHPGLHPFRAQCILRLPRLLQPLHPPLLLPTLLPHPNHPFRLPRFKYKPLPRRHPLALPLPEHLNTRPDLYLPTRHHRFKHHDESAQQRHSRTVKALSFHRTDYREMAGGWYAGVLRAVDLE